MKQNVSLHPKKNSSSERLPGTPESFWTGEHLGFTSASRLEPWPGFPTHGNEQKHMVRMASLQFQGNYSTSKPEKWPAKPGSNQFNSWIHTLKSARAEWRSYSKTKPLWCLLWLWLSKTVGVRIFPRVEAARTTIQRTHTSSWEDTSMVPFQHDWITPRTDDNSILHISLPEKCSVILLLQLCHLFWVTRCRWQGPWFTYTATCCAHSEVGEVGVEWLTKERNTPAPLSCSSRFWGLGLFPFS